MTLHVDYVYRIVLSRYEEGKIGAIVLASSIETTSRAAGLNKNIMDLLLRTHGRLIIHMRACTLRRIYGTIHPQFHHFHVRCFKF